MISIGSKYIGIYL